MAQKNAGITSQGEGAVILETLGKLLESAKFPKPRQGRTSNGDKNLTITLKRRLTFIYGGIDYEVSGGVEIVFYRDPRLSRTMQEVICCAIFDYPNDRQITVSSKGYVRVLSLHRMQTI